MDEALLILDADMLAHRCMARHQVEVQWSEDVWQLAGNVTLALHDYNETVQMFAEEWNVDPMLILHCFTGSRVFRYKLFPEYKPRRRPKPVGYKALKQRIAEQYGISYVMHEVLEADDIISILARQSKIQPVILSGDKDLLQIPGYHFWIDDQGKPSNKGFIDHVQADRNLCAQVLVGDSTDGIPGCPGCGAISAEKILTEHWPLGAWEAIVRQFEKAKERLAFGRVPSEEAVLQARLVRLLRPGDYDFGTRQIKLWTPNSVSESLPMD